MTDGGSDRRFAGQIALLAGARLASVASFFGVSVVAARLLPPDAVGSAAAGQTIGMIAALVGNGGLNIATIYFLQRRPDERASLVPRLTALAIIACALAFGLVLLSAPLVLGPVIDADAWSLLWVAAAMAAAMIGFEFGGALMLGFGRNGGYTLMELVRGAGSLAAVGVLLLGPMRSDSGFVIGLAAGYGLAAAIGLVVTDRSGASILPRFDGGVAREAVGFGIRGQAGNIFTFLGSRLDLLLVPALLDLRAAGLYVIAVRVSDVVGQAATAAASLVFPRVAGLADQGTELTERTVRMMLVVVVAMAVVLGLMGETLLRIAFGPAYEASTTALLILLVATIPLSVSRIVSADLKGRGRPGLVSWAAVVTVVTTVALDLLLIPAFGIEGASVASLLAYAAGMVAVLWAYRAVTSGRLAAMVPRPADARRLAQLLARPRAGDGEAGS